MERMYKITGLVIALFMLFSIDSNGQEFLVYDAIKTNKLNSADSGFIFFQHRASTPDNWESPVDYSDGSFHIRYEIMEVPTNETFNLNVCIWQYLGTETGKWDSLETCTQQQVLSGTGVTVQETAVSTWYKKDGLPINWSDPAGFNSMGVALFNDAGCVVTGFEDAGVRCWEDAPKYLDMKLRIIVVAVSNGGTFSGWNNYVAPNNPPVITSDSITIATEDVLYEYQVTATDADVNDVLTYSLTDPPSWLSIDSSTGLISGTPTDANIGDTIVVAKVTDGKDNATQTYTLSVANVNSDPIITSTPPTDATEGMQYSYQVEATDEDGGDVLVYSLSVKPSWLNIDSSSGLVSGTPLFEDGGDNDVEVTVDDGNGGNATQAFVVKVETVTITGISDLDGIKRLSLEQNYPNPFNFTTSIPFNLKEESEVKISIFNLSGKEITTLFAGRKSAGNHSIKFNATNLPNGIYFYSLDTGDHNEIKKMVLKK